MVKSSYRECECHTRILIVRGVPALNFGIDPAGTVAVTITDPRKGRFLGKDEEPGPLEHRHSVHECGHTRHRAQRGRWTAALHADRADGRRRRTTPAQPELMPGMGRIPPRRTTP